MTSDRSYSPGESTNDVPNQPPSFFEVMNHRADSGIAKLQNNSSSNRDNYEEVFGRVHITGIGVDEQAIDWAAKNFDRMDVDSNGFVTTAEMLNTHRRSQQADQLRLHALHYKYMEIQNASNDEWGKENDGFTRKDLAAYNSILEYRERIRPSRWDE